MALDHISIFGLVVVVAEGGLHLQGHHGGVANAVPTLLHGDGALGLVLDDGSGYGEDDVVLHLHSIRAFGRDAQLGHIA